jgi:YjjG family noncanonical pyrimidine nucleotidase
VIKAVLFDIDNTLLSFDEYVKESMKNGFEKFGIATYNDEMFAAFTQVNSKLWRLIEKGEMTFEELLKTRWNKIFEHLGISADGVAFEKYFRERLFDSAIPENGAMDLLKYLHGKYILCVASNGPYQQQKNRLKVGGMLPYFSDLFISEEIGSSKPAKSFFTTCFERLNSKCEQKIQPNEIIIIGDSLTSDMAGGIRFGMQTCFYNPAKKEVPSDVKIDYTVTTLNEITNIL